MPPPFPHIINPFGFLTDLAFAVVAVVFCFLIYFKTRESYELTKHKGIGYFRDAFLFFGLSYALRFLFSVTLLSRIVFDAGVGRESMRALMPLFILLLGYFSTIGIIYLIFSSIWKRFDQRALLLLGHGIAILLSVVTFATRSHRILLLLQLVLLVAAAVLSFAVRQRISQARALNLLVCGLWLINLVVLDRPRPFGLGLFFQAVSLAVFVVIYVKISKWTR